MACKGKGGKSSKGGCKTKKGRRMQEVMTRGRNIYV